MNCNSNDENTVSKVKIKTSPTRQKVIEFGIKRTGNVDRRQSTPIRESIINQLPNLSLGGINTELSKLSADRSEIDLKVTNKLYDLPERITGTYTDDYNILEVHECILKQFSLSKERKLQQLGKKLEAEKKKVIQPQTYIDRKKSLKLIEDVEKEISDIKGDIHLKKYLEEVELYISSYRQLGPIPKVIIFKNEATKIEKSPHQDTNIIDETTPPTPIDTGSMIATSKEIDESVSKKYRHMLITRYLEIAQKYIQIDVIREISSENTCDSCGVSLDEATVDDSGILKCTCGVMTYTISKQPAYKDSVRISTSSRNSYEDKENFIKTVMRFQGKQNNRIQLTLFNEFDAFFSSYGLPIGEEIKKRPLDERGRRIGTDKAMMYKCLQETGNAALYEDINLILHSYWGWDLPNISHLEDRLFSDYDKSQRIYESIKNDRSSCLNTQYRLFKHLQLLNYPCKSNDFKIIGTRDILEYHEMIWEKICRKLGWTFIKTI